MPLRRTLRAPFLLQGGVLHRGAGMRSMWCVSDARVALGGIRSCSALPVSGRRPVGSARSRCRCRARFGWRDGGPRRFVAGGGLRNCPRCRAHSAPPPRRPLAAAGLDRRASARLKCRAAKGRMDLRHATRSDARAAFIALPQTPHVVRHGTLPMLKACGAAREASAVEKMIDGMNLAMTTALLREGPKGRARRQGGTYVPS